MVVYVAMAEESMNTGIYEDRILFYLGGKRSGAFTMRRAFLTASFERVCEVM